MSEEKIKQLEEQLAKLLEEKEQRVHVTVPHHVKLRKYSGIERASDWIIEARAAIKSVKETERVDYLYRHLEGEARDEVKFSDASLKRDAEAIFKILNTAFKDARSNAKIKQALFNRTQRPGESVRVFTRALLDLADRLSDARSVKELMLKEVLEENLRDDYVRRQCKSAHQSTPDMSFADLRQKAIDLAEDEETLRRRDVPVRGVSGDYDVTSSADRDASCCATSLQTDSFKQINATMERMMEHQSRMMEQQAQILNLVVSQGTRQQSNSPQFSGNHQSDYSQTGRQYSRQSDYTHSGNGFSQRPDYSAAGNRISQQSSGSRQSNNTQSKGNNNPYAHKKCYRCKQTGHLARDCEPRRKQQTTAVSQAVQGNFPPPQLGAHLGRGESQAQYL